ncbi:hypothetical protein EN833_08255 [Mesorhizobium sp. M4B.F.Ca.ET.190.01.1.1]|uniref:hypothetical protein n=1 Tax=unclassified Mesorhizobium TaxID=325217 RepID=UPI000FE38834|nr:MULTISPECIES: hypothetical protein [unclassified Mesorhizobium]RWX68021.1 hypothetical protein EN780_10450 [Mesorhizobium sp. M4B.F.Ca.ET.089.01.1.1]TGR13155.1 hypothetical protein EN843_08250 [Mesorhizobium sp. M4B.F.Ca.ET.200.01.1.1]TGS21366.1 hypothetical protein EN833_08255 [Mesorhizobium sp. M4B.F.Ca.ET.190.01.1.1]TGT32929.1 hypothetical protein EN815_10795 [Mesorhizobium sp. M4B.F.Ca.ET.172.01.1.1]TIT29167.1 MAG: hypothetical protein E5W86_03530 [Mesorhizobium sp.]
MKGRKTGGRVAGTPNKVTASIKEAVTEAFEKAGGVDYLVKLATEDPRTFCGLVGKVIPLQVDAKLDGPLTVQVLKLAGSDADDPTPK